MALKEYLQTLLHHPSPSSWRTSGLCSLPHLMEPAQQGHQEAMDSTASNSSSRVGTTGAMEHPHPPTMPQQQHRSSSSTGPRLTHTISSSRLDMEGEPQDTTSRRSSSSKDTAPQQLLLPMGGQVRGHMVRGHMVQRQEALTAPQQEALTGQQLVVTTMAMRMGQQGDISSRCPHRALGVMALLQLLATVLHPNPTRPCMHLDLGQQPQQLLHLMYRPSPPLCQQHLWRQQSLLL